MANPLTFTLPVASHGGAGKTTQTLGPFIVPAGYSQCRIQLFSIPTADYENAANSMDLAVFIARDGTNYPPDKDGGSNWQGGQVIQKGVTDPQPIINDIPLDPSWAGKPAKVVLTIPNAFIFGAVVTLT